MLKLSVFGAPFDSTAHDPWIEELADILDARLESAYEQTLDSSTIEYVGRQISASSQMARVILITLLCTISVFAVFPVLVGLLFHIPIWTVTILAGNALVWAAFWMLRGRLCYPLPRLMHLPDADYSRWRAVLTNNERHLRAQRAQHDLLARGMSACGVWTLVVGLVNLRWGLL